ncbi:MAG: hypothetical protein BJBARM4_0035 [Candidatus Parvarchaeum acidiphilum ARMAN-4]|jgi:hypothetical protein|uniref:Uncharacterized protein n=1 Tax=Candidatus Parvarchaeum acidiphilum ARMAN-4 TaxID=662760 RepID=D2EEA2_PARA4|nr:MAG: hypothetical protein BJBARM4_0035 [Candidatus Parvarchaeum acidiphilum ARMAN-4]
MKKYSFIKVFSEEIVNFIKFLVNNLEFFEEKVYKEDTFLYMLGVE